MTDSRPTLFDLLDQLEEIVLDGTRVPFSGSRLVNERDAIEAMDALREALPLELSRMERSSGQGESPPETPERRTGVGPGEPEQRPDWLDGARSGGWTDEAL